MTIFTIGHSTRHIDDFINLLQQNKVNLLVDIRTIPRSRHNPQYEHTALEKSLPTANIEYKYIKKLGGLRPSVKDSVNMAWRNKSFRNYADYMQTDEFKQGLDELINSAKSKQAAIMCAEAVPWRCHRSLVADALLIRSIVVKDIITKAPPANHKLTSFAQVNGQQITYPDNKTELDC